MGQALSVPTLIRDIPSPTPVVTSFHIFHEEVVLWVRKRAPNNSNLTTALCTPTVTPAFLKMGVLTTLCSHEKLATLRAVLVL